MAAVTTAVAGVAATAYSAREGRRAAGDAADAQAESADAAIAEQRAARLQAEENQRPFREFGENLLDDLSGILTGDVDITDDPVTQFQLADATRTINNRAAHAGKFFQPRTVEALMETRDGIISANRTQRVNELLAGVQIGQNTAVNQANQTQANANATGNLLTQRGNAIAAGEVGQANAINAGVAGVTDILTTFQNNPSSTNYNPTPVAMSDPNQNTTVINEALVGGGGV